MVSSTVDLLMKSPVMSHCYRLLTPVGESYYGLCEPIFVAVPVDSRRGAALTGGTPTLGAWVSPARAVGSNLCFSSPRLTVDPFSPVSRVRVSFSVSPGPSARHPRDTNGSTPVW